MMISNNKKKHFSNILLSAFLITVGTTPCMAFTGSMGITGGGGENGEATSDRPWFTYDEGARRYKYQYSAMIDNQLTITANAYDLNGESIIPYSLDIDTSKYKFKSGTWIGINVTENHSASWSVGNFAFQEIRKKYTCTYVKSGYTSCYIKQVICANGRPGCGKKVCYNVPSSTTSTTHTKYYNEEYTCPQTLGNGYNYHSQTVNDDIYAGSISGSAESTIKLNAAAAAHSTALSAVQSPVSSGVKYISSKTYPKDDEKLEYRTINVSTKGDLIDEYTSSYSGYVIQDYEFLQSNICMNVRTAEVTYGRDCNEDEINIENGNVYDDYLKENVNYWHYFIPLNTKSNQIFNLEIVENKSQVMSIDICESSMKQNSNYKNLIIPSYSNGEKYIVGGFSGDYNIYGRRSNDYKILTEAGGCFVGMNIEFPISQEFYNETPEHKLKGFNFYYKPISVNTNEQNIEKTVFPNGITDKSIWKEWYESEKKELDLTKSYNVITYTALNINAAKIRNYNRTNQYTDWSTMNLDGTSKFIDNYGIISRNTKSDVYKLGCGPSNAEWSDCK